MVWSVKEEDSLLRSLINLKQRCANYHEEELQVLPGVTPPWPSNTQTQRIRPGLMYTWNRQKHRNLSFLELNYANPIEAANDTRLRSWEFPEKRRLTDTGIYLAIKYLKSKHRYERHPYDFIRTGHIFRARVPSGKPVILWAHGIAWIAVWRKSHILCGDKLAHRAGWLLETGLEERKPSGDAAFLAGIVLAPTDIFPLEPGTFEVEMRRHENPADLDCSARNDRVPQSETNFCTDWNDLVIDLTLDGPRLTPMHKVPYLKRSCGNWKKYQYPPALSDYAPSQLFANDGNARSEEWEEHFYRFPRYPQADGSKRPVEETASPDENEPISDQRALSDTLGQEIVSTAPRPSLGEPVGIKMETRVHDQPQSLLSSKTSLPPTTEPISVPSSPTATPRPPLQSSSKSLPEAEEQHRRNPFKLAADMLGTSYLDIPKTEMMAKIEESATADEIQALYLAYCVVDDQRKRRRGN